MLIRENKLISGISDTNYLDETILNTFFQDKVAYGNPENEIFGKSFLHENKGRLSIDKIGIYIDKKYLNGDVYKNYLLYPNINIFQNNQHIWFLIHAEWDVNQIHHSLRVLSALCFLSLQKVFTQEFSTLIKQLLVALLFFKFDQPEIVAANILQDIVPIRCLEIAMDFEELPIISNYSINDFIQVADTTIYSRQDYQVLTRQSGTRTGERKEEQKSFLTCYDWQLKHGGKKPVYRLEFRFTRKYLKYLPHDILAGTTLSILNQQLDNIKETLWNLTIPQNLLFNGIWKTFGPSWFLSLITEMDWNNYKKGRKTQKKR